MVPQFMHSSQGCLHVCLFVAFVHAYASSEQQVKETRIKKLEEVSSQ